MVNVMVKLEMKTSELLHVITSVEGETAIADHLLTTRRFMLSSHFLLLAISLRLHNILSYPGRAKGSEFIKRRLSTNHRVCECSEHHQLAIYHNSLCVQSTLPSFSNPPSRPLLLFL
ncbi:hypothetical protein BCIN_01g06610 [Botrytis cinerea B05.10]|uniref:Uncharacterized protein n=1 Tax=Botryotinia fuckeliana (strain B05.10) TaxID=332648 RepID=A0A384J5W5_BOTFB|nr:hypothetical protein BCIN_01g06610 [Botrytis cinerea B05.10]ATZ45975.1 hypothetical protein BCIN_01g06610 [Botrytis cinerea B05.10]